MDYQSIILKIATQTATEPERTAFEAWLQTLPPDQLERVMEAYLLALQSAPEPKNTEWANPILLEKINNRIDTTIDSSNYTTTQADAMEAFAAETYPINHRRLMIRITTAAAIVAAVITGIYLWLQPSNTKPETAVVASHLDIPPGSNGAQLTLADGTVMVLDSMTNGQISIQNGVPIQLNNGLITYNDAGNSTPQTTNATVAYNTLSTPRGRQFQLVLPDGTKVWLNAASSIKYPTTFTAEARRVYTTGEVFFEVKKLQKNNQNIPFIVTAAQQEITVLGTQFNINSYNDEPFTKTTLLEGKVRVKQSGQTTDANELILEPGYQAISGTNKPLEHKKVNMDEVLAWRNQAFSFNNTGIEEVMRQLSRWYDIEVTYQTTIPTQKFGGEIGMDLTLSQVLMFLEQSEVKFKLLEGKKLVVIAEEKN